MPNHRVCSIGFTVFCTFAFSIFLCTTALAQNWQNPAGGDFNNGANWAGGQFPTDPNFNLNSAGYVTTLSAPATIATLTVQSDNPTLNLNNSTLDLGLPVVKTVPGAVVNIATQAGQNGSLTLLGPGTLDVEYSPGVLNVGNSGAGQLIINGATLRQDGYGQSVTIGSQGSLTIENGGQYIGNDPGGGVFSSTGTINIMSGGSLNTRADSATFGTLNIQLGPSNYSSESLLTGGLFQNQPVNITLAPGFTPIPFHEMDVVLQYGEYSGNFFTNSLPALPPGESWDTSKFSGFSGQLEVVPEPAGTAILLAAAGLLLRRRTGKQ